MIPAPVPTPSLIPAPVPTPSPTPTQASVPTPSSPSYSASGLQYQQSVTSLVTSAPEPQIETNSNSPKVEIDTAAFEIDQSFTSQFEAYLGISEENASPTLAESRQILSDVERATGTKPALLYIRFIPDGGGINPSVNPESKTQGKNKGHEKDSLELVMVTATGEPIRKRIPYAMRSQVLEVAKQFHQEVTTASKRNTNSYLKPAQQLYKWLLAPLEEELEAQGIQNLVLILDSGLRTIPVAALHDGQHFLIEKYSLGLMPSLNLTDTRYQDIRKMEVLAMGASEFTDKTPLPAVPVELNAIAKDVWTGELFLNEAFTLDNLKSQRNARAFGIIHLATHAEFQRGKASNSYIQLWDSKLQMDQVRQLGWHNPAVELLVLSACRTAVGDEEAELGFAGLAVQAGVKSALASLWYVSDEGTLALMTEFYQQLHTVPIKAEALRQAQIAMIQNNVRLQQGHLLSSKDNIALPPSLTNLANKNLSHPYYWAGFTMIGSPW
ncbi:CHAT domain-containing protein [Microcoleus sp. FACHB-68]|nr:CHAT domain-containing protein [Microcoleus sp. FACHB-68]